MYHILIVDDEPDILKSISMMMDWELFGAAPPATAQSCTEALDAARKDPPDIVLADIRMDDGWGYDLPLTFRENGLKAYFIMISGYDDFQYVRQSLVNGARDYLLKPVAKDALMNAIRKIVEEELGGTVRPEAAVKIDSITGHPFSAYSNLTAKLVSVLQRRYGEKLSLNMLADQFKVNNKYLGRIFSQDTGLKFSEYLFVLRLETASAMLRDSEDTVQEIAQRVGYSYMPYFYKHFKSYFGISPSTFRPDAEEESQ